MSTLEPPSYDLLLVRFGGKPEVYRFPLCEVIVGTYGGKDKDGLVVFITKEEERHLSISKFHEELKEALADWGQPTSWVIWPHGKPPDQGVRDFLNLTKV